MKVICDRAALLAAINLVSGAVAARTPRVQLTCVKLVATKEGNAGELTLSATDAEIALKLTLAQVDVKEPGEALIPAERTLYVRGEHLEERGGVARGDDRIKRLTECLERPRAKRRIAPKHDAICQHVAGAAQAVARDNVQRNAERRLSLGLGFRIVARTRDQKTNNQQTNRAHRGRAEGQGTRRPIKLK